MLSMSFITLLVLLSFMVTWTKNVFMSLMYSVMLFINATVVLLMLGFEFLALINMLVYVGALAVLFLFVIMLI
jgi:NADH:ubiquinone oxidoreductase subunit 6 (subunit J)